MVDYDRIEELEIECTTLCNAKCPLCYRNYKSFQASPYNKPIVRPLVDVVAQLDRMPNLDYVMLVGSMSEPTLYEHFIDLVDYLKRRHIRLEICTNGSTNNDLFWKNLAQSLDLNDKVYFTICGSTQEIHEKYRLNTSLAKILHNASIVRGIIPIDYAQCIRFNYNSNDFDSHEFKNMISVFSHIYMTETFYPKPIEKYNIEFDIANFMPNSVKLDLYNKLKKFVTVNSQSKYVKTINDCICINRKRFQIDVFGNIYPCYLFLEYMNGDIWNQDMAQLKNVNYQCCSFCEKYAKMFSKKHNLDYII